MQLWIDHPGAQNPVSLSRWVKWKLSEWCWSLHLRLEREALWPNCDDCGRPLKRGDHSKCDQIPF